MDAQTKRWKKPVPPDKEHLLELYEKEGLVPYTWSNAPGDYYSPHSHSYYKVIYVLSGSITWILPESNQEIVTHPGDRLDLPPGITHAARVGPQGVTCLEAHRG